MSQILKCDVASKNSHLRRRSLAKLRCTGKSLSGRVWASTPAARAEYAAFDQRRTAFRELTRAVRGRLQAVYADPTLDEDAKRARKQAVMDDFRREYAALKAFWGGFSAFDAWVARANNALLGAQGAYDRFVPAFEALYEREGRDFGRFYDAVRGLAELPRPERHAALQALAPTR